ncbi:MAG TPA: phospholipase, partial [Candidatus Dormibacteraeota bacterium]
MSRTMGPDVRQVGTLENWFLTGPERGNDFTELDRRHPDGAAWTAGNQVETLVHGATYFRRLLDAVKGLKA